MLFMCCRWEWVWGWEPLFSCLSQCHGHLLLLLSPRPYYLSWRQDLSGYVRHTHIKRSLKKHSCSVSVILALLSQPQFSNSVFSIFLDIDECSLGGNVCRDGQDCENTIGSYRCVMRCGRGFRRTVDGHSCTGTSTSLDLWNHLLWSATFYNSLPLLLRCERVSGVQSMQSTLSQHYW